ncbi:NHL repeat-containing protein [Streptomyces sp. JJ66]|uniref:NHL repeat-containing protein n=1 Tax=Streptomyces sp. JJ66 TaxID=2803843 RepID=UPI001C590D54|nr:NHL repeat-containing protein [Streptomyces sp. JJ66]MBW1604678.1 NHL repeat-containing protein [Streptomyces sp. JJ66]
MRRSAVALLGALLATLPVSAASAGRDHGAAPPDELRQTGRVSSGEDPVPFARVTLYQAGEERGGQARALGRARGDAEGRFTLRYRPPEDDEAVLYLVADAPSAQSAQSAQSSESGEKGRSGAREEPGRDGQGDEREPVRLTSVLLPEPSPTPTVVNERTTVATAFALARFAHGADLAGSYPGLHNAAATSHNLADVKTGRVSPVLDAPPNGAETSTRRAFNSLANLLAGCVAGETCAELFRLARPAGGPEPRDTFQAAVDIAHAPGEDVSELFALSRTVRPYTPALEAAPDAWTLALRYDGNGHELNGPGNLAFDADGNAWIINNYHFDRDPRTPVCGGEQLLKFTPTGEDAPGAPYRGGGLYGAGFGVTLDPRGDVWVGNFGFQGRGCELDQNELNHSVSQFRADGTALSPVDGWHAGGIDEPQGMAADRDGNVWVANCGGESVTRIADGEPGRARRIVPEDGDLVEPFDVTVDTRGRAWATGNRSHNVFLMAPDGRPLRTLDGGGILAPMGIASDSLGNVWVANSGVIDPPCGDALPKLPPTEGVDAERGADGASVTLIGPDGSMPAEPFSGGGLFLPWGIAVDGADTVWVANFGGQRVVQLCGAQRSACPPGHETGQPISPAETGYTSDGLVRATGVQIDPSGNVWLANNWETVPLQTNPGGHEMVVFVGLAEPVRTPLLGAPRTP